jgi:hypothetical protein
MKKSTKAAAYVSDAARAAARLAAILVLTTALGRAVAQEPVPVPSHRAQPRMAGPVPATLPHTQLAGPQRGAPPKPTVVLKPGEVPAISFEQPTWDFGRVKAGADLTHDFVFTNTGTGPLEILEVRPG